MQIFKCELRACFEFKQFCHSERSEESHENNKILRYAQNDNKCLLFKRKILALNSHLTTKFMSDTIKLIMNDRC
jgi:hypothetical protein